MAQKREGPFTILKKISPVVFQLKLPKTWKIHDKFHASLLTPATENYIYGPHHSQPPPTLVDQEEEMSDTATPPTETNNNAQTPQEVQESTPNPTPTTETTPTPTQTNPEPKQPPQSLPPPPCLEAAQDSTLVALLERIEQKCTPENPLL
ncbi:hypothetical protein P691DRAFT_768149 [Macrolepiota fuliginosa MF-IS2]|uniref:Tf2-1-like SH3-like domain-containing protein n=1 Tax=Macrolepiota fuliginosa MF-IS2 TaxID=1400762 RepID=A0A9P5WXC6_9AGAR|nr:hypothetical protein P691DRAFT_768149 [Macrolepiota fuliginosa MF-IS2]